MSKLGHLDAFRQIVRIFTSKFQDCLEIFLRVKIAQASIELMEPYQRPLLVFEHLES